MEQSSFLLKVILGLPRRMAKYTAYTFFIPTMSVDADISAMPVMLCHRMPEENILESGSLKIVCRKAKNLGSESFSSMQLWSAIFMQDTYMKDLDSDNLGLFQADSV